MGAVMLPQVPAGFQAPEPYVPESAKAAGALYEAGVDFDPVAYRNQFKSGDTGLASVAQPIEPVNLKQPTSQETVSTFRTQRGGSFSPRQQEIINKQRMPSFYQQPMGMMAQPFNPMGYGPMGMFMNPYGGLGGMSYNFMNRPMPLYGQGGQFTAGQYQAPKPIAPTQPSFGFGPYGGIGYF